jgi:flavin-dependent dehydrogenase
MIVGAGPAGSFAAERLARGGVRVALFDGRPEGEEKACGGGVTTKALKMWPYLRVPASRTIHEVEMYSPAGRKLVIALDEPFAIYSRSVFDSYLRERAREAGAHVFAGRVSFNALRQVPGGWVLQGHGGEGWKGNMLVAADGANSRIAHELSGAMPPSDMEVAFGYRAPLPEGGEAPLTLAFLNGWAGYAWAFPRLNHISFGIATTQEAFDHTALEGLLWDFMTGYYGACDDRAAPLWSSGKQDVGRSKGVRAELEAKAERYAARIPGLAVESWGRRRTVGDGWALLGDAAGFCDPVTGEGIYYAMRSGELFAEAYLAGKPAAYQASWQADFGHELKRAAKIRSVFYGNICGAPFTEMLVHLARRHRGLRKVLGEMVTGAQGYTNLRSKVANIIMWPF